MTVPNTLSAIQKKVRRITGRPSVNQLSDSDLNEYINTFYIYDFTQHLHLENLRTTYQFITTANRPVYDLPTDLYLAGLPPVFIAGYQSYMTQSRENFFRVNPGLNFLQQQVYTSNGTNGPYTGQFLTNTPIVPGFKPNPPGAYIANAQGQIEAKAIHWNVLVSALGVPDATTGISPSISLIDDGQGNLIDINDPGTTPVTGFVYRGTVNYITGAIDINSTGFTANIPTGNAINVQYIPYVASRPQSVVFYQDQFILYPIPDQAYTVSFEAYQYPTAFLGTNLAQTPQVQEWWQLIAIGTSLLIFEDNGDLENYAKYRQIFDEALRMVQRRTIVQQTPERTASIYTEQSAFSQYPFGNNFSGF